MLHYKEKDSFSMEILETTQLIIIICGKRTKIQMGMGINIIIIITVENRNLSISSLITSIININHKSIMKINIISSKIIIRSLLNNSLRSSTLRTNLRMETSLTRELLNLFRKR